jgi:hypothetical protein
MTDEQRLRAKWSGVLELDEERTARQAKFAEGLAGLAIEEARREGHAAGRKEVGEELVELAKGLAEHADLAGVLPIALTDIGQNLIEGRGMLREWPIVIDGESS